MDEFLRVSLGLDIPSDVLTDADVSIERMMENLAHSARTNTAYAPPIEKAVPHGTLNKSAAVAAPAPEADPGDYLPWVSSAPQTTIAPSNAAPEPRPTIRPAEDSPLAKRYSEYSKQPTRVEKEPCETGGVWVRHFDENGNLFRVFLAPDDVTDEGY